MITIGVDAHKRVHAAVAVDEASRALGQWRGPNPAAGWQQLAERERPLSRVHGLRVVADHFAAVVVDRGAEWAERLPLIAATFAEPIAGVWASDHFGPVAGRTRPTPSAAPVASTRTRQPIV